MEEYQLNNKELDWLNELVKITTSIEVLYKKLYELEINGNKDSQEYQKTLDYLDITTEVEEELYKKGYLNFEKSNAFCKYIYKDRLPEEFIHKDLEAVVTHNYNNRVLRRILKRLSSTASSDLAGIEKTIPEDFIDIMEQIGIPNVSQLFSQSFSNFHELQNIFEKDMLNALLTFLQDYAKSTSYADLRNAFIQAKYNISFINKEIEIELRTNSFNVSDTVFSNSKMVAYYADLDNFLYNYHRDACGTTIASHQIGTLLEMSDKDYDDKEQALSAILRQALLRAAFLLMNEESIEELHDNYHSFIENPDYYNNHPNNNLSEKAISNCFLSINKDKNKYLVLSFGTDE